MSKSLCIIPARGGSKRIPGKNLKPLNGKPLISHTIDSVVKAGVFDEIVVSSDDEQILNIAEESGVRADKRSLELSGDKVKAVEVIEEYLERNNCKDNFDFVFMVLPTCPFRSVGDVKNSFEQFVNNKSYDFLISVVEYDFPIELNMSFDDESLSLEIIDIEAYRRSTRSQEQRPFYHPNGAIYGAKVGKFLELKTFFTSNIMGYKMTQERSFDIDYPYQFKIAEIMAKEFFENE